MKCLFAFFFALALSAVSPHVALADGSASSAVAASPWRWSLSAAMPVVSVALRTGSLGAGVMPESLGPCWGLSYHGASGPEVGADLCTTFRISQNEPNQLTQALLWHLGSWAAIGVGVRATANPTGVIWDWLGFVSPRLPIL
jgi:hypothetical protein